MRKSVKLTPILIGVITSLLWSIACLGQSPKPWYARTLVGMEVGPTGAQFGSDPRDVGYASRFDGAEVVREAAKAGSEYVVVWARDSEYAYYQSKVAPVCPGMGSRDVLREAVEEGKKQHIPVLAYCVVQCAGAALRAHPEWAMRGPDGKPLGRFCMNSGYLEYVKKLTAEMLAYGIDGLHIDMLDQGFGAPYGCWCDTCKLWFKNDYDEKGPIMPKGATWDEPWERMLQFRYNSSYLFEKSLRTYLRNINPKATVDFNYHGNPPFSFEVGQLPVQHATQGDFNTGETGVWGFSALAVGLNARFYAAATPGQPYQVAMQRGVRMYHDQTTRPLNDIRWELFTLLAHGAFVTMVDKTAFDGRLDTVAYERIGKAFREARLKRSHFGQGPVADVGIYYSAKTRDWIGRDKPAKYQQGFNGAHRAMVYEHIPFGIVFDERALPVNLKPFKTILIPNGNILQPHEVLYLKQYVMDGGRLVITGFTGQFNKFGLPMQESSLAELIGAQVLSRLDSQDNHVRFAKGSLFGDAISAGIPRDWSFLVEGPATVYMPTTAKPIGELLKPRRTMRQLQGKEGFEWPMSAGEVVGPAALINRIGKGTVITLACSPDIATASEHPVVEARKLLRNAVNLGLPSKRIVINAPVNVESVVTDDKINRVLRVHLVAYNAPASPTSSQNRPFVMPALIEDLPMYRVEITLAEAIKKVGTLNKSTTVSAVKNKITGIVNDIHEVIIIQY